MGLFSLHRLRRGLSSPNLFLRELNRWYHRRLFTRPYNTAGVDIFGSDWDNLMVLDACRYDTFEQQHELDGTLDARYSRGSNTREWLQANFDGKELLDTVYVTANPMLYRHRDSIDVTLHAVVHVWEEEGWDETHQTVLPETTAQQAIEAAETYPEKRLLVHFIQPHYPFLTEDDQPFESSQAFLRPEEPGSWNQIMTGEITADPDAVWTAYRATLDRALPSVERLLTALDGKSVVTADHGNMVGERAQPFPIREWGHPRSLYTQQLVKVPWLTVDGPRRNIVAEEPDESQRGSEPTDVEERLEDLGYV